MNKLDKYDQKLIDFIGYVESLLKIEKDEEVITNKVSKELKDLINQRNIIPDNFKIPNPNKYTLYPLYVSSDNSFSIASAVWNVGQFTPVHDHGTWGVIGIDQGEEKEVHYEQSKDGLPLIKKFERKLIKGDVAVCCSTDQDVHEVSCLSNIPCVGIHIYGNNIGEVERNIYDKNTSKAQKVITAWDPIPN